MCSRSLLPGLGALTIAATLAGCPAGGTRGPDRCVNVLLVTLDTTRADRLGCYGNARIDTPILDRLAREGTLFENAFTPIPSTLPSHCSIMTGTYPARHGVHDNGVYLLDDAATTLAEILDSRGYATAAFVSAFVLDRQFQLDQGFDLYDDEMTSPLIDADLASLPDSLPEGHRKWIIQEASAYQRRADAVTPRAVDWLEQERTEPFFLWVHYFDPHQPYAAPGARATEYDPGYDGPMDGDIDTFYREMGRRAPADLQRDWDHMVARYDAEIACVDEWLGQLLQALDDTGRADETLIVVVGDHGESFGDHGIQFWEHNQTIYDEVVRVPLIIRRPDGIGSGTRVDQLVRTIDVAPSILDWLDLPDREPMQGVSLLPLAVDADALGPEQVLLEALRGEQLVPTPRSHVGLRTRRHKLIVTLGPDEELADTDGTGQVELFDVVQDSGEKRSLFASQAELGKELRRRLAEMYRDSYREVDAHRELDAVDSDALRSLGYAE